MKNSRPNLKAERSAVIMARHWRPARNDRLAKIDDQLIRVLERAVESLEAELRARTEQIVDVHRSAAVGGLAVDGKRALSFERQESKAAAPMLLPHPRLVRLGNRIVDPILDREDRDCQESARPQLLA